MILLNKKNIITSLIALAALCDFLYFLPIFGDVSKQMRVISISLAVVSGFVLAISLFNKGCVSRGKMLIAIWMLYVFFWLYGLSPLRLATCIGLFAILILERDLQKLALEKFQEIFCVIVLVNVLAYPLISVGWLPSFGEIDPDHWLKQEAGIYYENFGISFVQHGLFNSMQVGDFLLYRMSAWFEEPGNVGTISALLLAATDFKMDWKGKVLLVGGVFSFSLAFFAMVTLYTSMKKPKVFLYLLLVMIFSAVYFQDNEFLSSKIFDRISISDQGVSGDNRTEKAFDSAYQEYMGTQSVWLGHDSEHQINKLHYNSSSWKNLVWDHGLIGTALFLSVFVVIFVHGLQSNALNWFVKLKQLLPFALVFLLNIYQRPNVLILSFFIIFVGAMVAENSKERRTHG